MAATRAVVADRLRAQLGREPTEEEVIEEVLANDAVSFLRGGRPNTDPHCQATRPSD